MSLVERKRQAPEQDAMALREKIKSLTDELMRYLEEYAIPLAVESYLSGKEKRRTEGKVQWGNYSFFSERNITVEVWLNCQDYMFRTDNSIYDLSPQVTAAVEARVNALASTTENGGFYIEFDRKPYQELMNISITFKLS